MCIEAITWRIRLVIGTPVAEEQPRRLREALFAQVLEDRRMRWQEGARYRRVSGILLVILSGLVLMSGVGCDREKAGYGAPYPYGLSGILREAGSDRRIGGADFYFNDHRVASSSGSGHYSIGLGTPPGPPMSGTLRVQAYGYREASFSIPDDAEREPDSELSYRLDIVLEYLGQD